MSPQNLLFCCYHLLPLHMFGILSFVHSLSKEESYVFQEKAWSVSTSSRVIDRQFVEIPVKRQKFLCQEARQGKCMQGSKTCLTSNSAKCCHSFRDLAGRSHSSLHLSLPFIQVFTFLRILGLVF